MSVQSVLSHALEQAGVSVLLVVFCFVLNNVHCRTNPNSASTVTSGMYVLINVGRSCLQTPGVVLILSLPWDFVVLNVS